MRLVRSRLGPRGAEVVWQVREGVRRLERALWTCYGRLVGTGLKRLVRRKAGARRLEIGPGEERIPGFETLALVGDRHVDYVLDASEPLPFADDTFEVLYASHVLEHVPWYRTHEVLREWVRILQPGGTMEIWVPDAAKIFRTVLEADAGHRTEPPEQWRARNDEGDVYLWAAGRLLWGANPAYPSWHRSMFTPESLRRALRAAGLVRVRRLTAGDVRGIDHGWINLGMGGVKP